VVYKVSFVSRWIQILVITHPIAMARLIKNATLHIPPAFGTSTGGDAMEISPRSYTQKKLDFLGYHAELIVWWLVQSFQNNSTIPACNRHTERNAIAVSHFAAAQSIMSNIWNFNWDIKSILQYIWLSSLSVTALTQYTSQWSWITNSRPDIRGHAADAKLQHSWSISTTSHTDVNYCLFKLM